MTTSEAEPRGKREGRGFTGASSARPVADAAGPTPRLPNASNVATYVRCRCSACTQARHPAGATRHKIRIRLLTTGWRRWRADCVCGWRSRSNSTRLVAEQFGAEHFRPVTSGGGPE